jgi:hypothetical protein
VPRVGIVSADKELAHGMKETGQNEYPPSKEFAFLATKWFFQHKPS